MVTKIGNQIWGHIQNVLVDVYTFNFQLVKSRSLSSREKLVPCKPNGGQWKIELVVATHLKKIPNELFPNVVQQTKQMNWNHHLELLNHPGEVSTRIRVSTPKSNYTFPPVEPQ